MKEELQALAFTLRDIAEAIYMQNAIRSREIYDVSKKLLAIAHTMDANEEVSG
jgi:hypothetical protein